MDALATVPAPHNEPVLGYEHGSPERTELDAAIIELTSATHDLPMTIGDQQVTGHGEPIQVVQPHRHDKVLGVLGNATAQDARDAIRAALAAADQWSAMAYEDRAAIFLKAADLLAGPWRARMNAATMLGQSKTIDQAEIDAACELIDFWRFNAWFGQTILAEQPTRNAAGSWNRLDHRPLEGFVYAITPFNFTSIAANLPTAPALMGNVVVWKPSPTQQLAAHMTMELLREAGLPPGVINLVTGDGLAVSEVALRSPDLGGIHFTGSTATFQHLWRTVGEHIAEYRSYPRIVGETGGKGFVVAHPSADVEVLRMALIHGGFDYQGQKCSAASRAYVPRSVWSRLRDDLIEQIDALTVGDVTDPGTFMGAVIDSRAFARHRSVLEQVADDPAIKVLAGGSCDDSVGWFVRPTLLTCSTPDHPALRTEYFGPILTVYVFDDHDFDKVLRMVDQGAPYGLTGSIIARDRAAIVQASHALRHAAGNLYINDKPTGAVVGQQPFGGSRASGTNDKAGAAQNLRRWTSTRAIKELFVPARCSAYRPGRAAAGARA